MEAQQVIIVPVSEMNAYQQTMTNAVERVEDIKNKLLDVSRRSFVLFDSEISTYLGYKDKKWFCRSENKQKLQIKGKPIFWYNEELGKYCVRTADLERLIELGQIKK